MEVGEVFSSDEALVDIGAVEPGPADRAPVWVAADGRVGPVEVPRAGRYRVGERSAGDELLVHLGAVEPGPADRVVVLVGPVDVAGVDGQPGRAAFGVGDEVLVDPGAVEVGPVEVSVGGGYAIRRAGAGDELLVDVGAVQAGPADRAGAIPQRHD